MRANLILVGAGLSGAAFLAHLLRDHPDLSGRVVVVEPGRRLGAGLAYGTCDPAHRVNVAAGRMSLFPDRPDHFLNWLRKNGTADRDRDALGEDGLLHPRRALFGRYVNEAVAEEIARSPVEVQRRRARAAAAERTPDGWAVRLDTGERLEAPLLVLAVGHTAPDLPRALAGLRGNKRLVDDPWRRDALAPIEPGATVLVAGTGLTGCDVVASLRARGHRGRVLMVSRRGLLPRPRTRQAVEPFGRFDDLPPTTAPALLRRVRAAVAEARATGRPWEDVIAALREQAAAVWGALPVPERRRLLRHVRPFWDVHRFQCAPQIDRVVREGLADRWLSVRAAGLVDTQAMADGPAVAARNGIGAGGTKAGGAETDGGATGGAIAVSLRPRGGRAIETVRVDAVVNCTGPGHRSVVDAHPLLRSLAESGALRADPCRLGIDVDHDSRVLDRDGAAWPDLFVAGPLARGTHGELMGLPQVALQPRAVAASVAAIGAAWDGPAGADRGSGWLEGRPGALPLDPAQGLP